VTDEGEVPPPLIVNIGTFDEEIYEAVGSVAVAWSHLERRTHGALWTFASEGKFALHMPSRVLIAGMALPAQWDAIEVFLSQPSMGDADAATWFRDWRRKAERLQTRRNDAVHSSWAIDASNPEPSARAIDVVSRKARGGERWDVVPGGKADVTLLAEAIEKHHVDLADWTSIQWRRLNPAITGAPPERPTAVMWIAEFGPPA
jgi:hypothetical protein